MIIPTSFPNSRNPVKNIFIYEQATALKKNGNDICVLHIEKLPTKQLLSNASSQISIVDDGDWNRYTMQCKTFLDTQLPILNKKNFLKKMNQLFEYAVEKEGRPDIIYAHFCCWAGYAAVEIGKKHGIPVAYIEHFSGLISGRSNPILFNSVRYCLQNSQLCIAVSDRLKSAMQSIMPQCQQIHVIPNLIDDLFEFVEYPQNEIYTFCSVGRLSPPKDFAILINAFCHSFSSEDKVQLLIGGDGELKDTIQKQIKTLNREHQIKLLGRLNREETKQLYGKSNSFVLPSSFETFGIVWREAMAVGRPVITTDHGGWGNGEWKDEFGIMIPIGNEQALFEAMKKMYQRKDGYYDYQRISNECKNRYSAKKIASQLNALFDTTVKKYR